jgi:hypothetical protein
MRSFVPPTCLKAIRVKTVASVSTEMFSWNICNRS